MSSIFNRLEPVLSVYDNTNGTPGGDTTPPPTTEAPTTEAPTTEAP